jgi:thiosulfate dehydrogenase (quinone) large subunit
MPKKAHRRHLRSRHPSWIARPRAPLATDKPDIEPRTTRSDSWLRYALVPLRVFLGLTFAYAGVQKLTDSGFLSADGRTYIGRQLEGFALHSPIGGLLTWLSQNTAVAVGVTVITVELAVGAAVLAGYRTRLAATAGAVLSFILFLSASWDVQPYFLGSDSIYTVAWITLAVAGDQGVWVLAARFGRPGRQPQAGFDPERRRLLLQIGGAAIGLIWILGLVPRARSTLGGAAVSPLASSGTATSPAAPSATPGSPTPSPTPASQGTAIGTLQQLQSQGSIAYQDPKSGDPAVVVDIGGTNVVAYDAVCTHAGCTVQYDPSQRVLFCPCHGAAFDPAHQAAVIQGPAPTPLASLQVTVGSDGNLYAANS